MKAFEQTMYECVCVLLLPSIIFSQIKKKQNNDFYLFYNNICIYEMVMIFIRFVTVFIPLQSTSLHSTFIPIMYVYIP